MKRSLVLAVALAAAVIVLPTSSAPAARAACLTSGQVFVYGQNGWDTLMNALAANPTPCVQYYIVLNAISDKTYPRGKRVVDVVHSKGPNFHALAEFNWTGWSRVKPANWYSKAVIFRRRMAAAGYDPTRDSWAVNELSSAVRAKPTARAKVRNALRGLYTGPRGSPPLMGAAFVIGMGQTRPNVDRYKAQVESWLVDGPFWSAVTPYVAWWGQETYVSCSKVCVAGQKVAVRSTHVNEFVEHPARLAYAGPPTTLPARTLFDRSYFPLMTAYLADTGGYGGNAISPDTMQRLASLEVYAARAWAGRNPYPDGRLGFAWNEHPPGVTPAQLKALATRIAQAIQGAYGDAGTAAKACGSPTAYTFCRPSVRGASFTSVWTRFGSW